MLAYLAMPLAYSDRAVREAQSLPRSRRYGGTARVSTLSVTGRGFGVEIGDPVPGAVDGVQERACIRLVDHAAQVVQVRAQGVGIGQRVAPDLALDVVPGNHARRFPHQDGQQLETDRRDLQFLAAAGDPQGRGVELEVADLVHLARNLPPLAPDQGADTRLQ